MFTYSLAQWLRPTVDGNYYAIKVCRPLNDAQHWVKNIIHIPPTTFMKKPNTAGNQTVKVIVPNLAKNSDISLQISNKYSLTSYSIEYDRCKYGAIKKDCSKFARIST